MQRIRYSKYFKLFFILTDVVILAAVFIYFFFKSNSYRFDFIKQENHLLLVTIFILFWILLSGRTKLYNVPRNLTYTLYLERLISHIIVFIIGVNLLVKISDSEFMKTDRFLISGILLSILLVVKSALFFVLKYIRSLGINHRNVMFLSENSSFEVLKNILTRRKDYGFKIFEFPKDPVDNINELTLFWKEKGIHTLYIPSEYSKMEKEYHRHIFHEAEKHQVKIVLIPDIVQNNFFQYDLNYIESQPILSQVKFPLDYLANFLIKRTFDLLFSGLVLLLICSWLFPLIALLIRIDSKGNIFFVQKRHGFHDEIFNCLKFRSMYQNDYSSSKTTEQDDPRITRFGRFLRKTSLDELPQFLNVFLGQMSIVGPRPHMLLVEDRYKIKIGRYAIRSYVKPGITGLAQVSGLRGDIGDMDIEMQKRILADSFYVKNWSFMMDIVIILKTILLIIRGDKKAV